MIDSAIESKVPIKPKKIINISISVILATLVAITIAFLIDYMNTKIIRPEDVERLLGISILGVLPDENKIR